MKIALRQYWPGTATGEAETLKRLETAIRKLGHEVFWVEAGSPSEETELLDAKPLFLLDLHFALPRAKNVFSVGALWNPTEYFTLWGGGSSLEAQFDHDMFVAANVELAKAQVRALRPDLEHPVLPLNHTVSESSFREPSEASSPGVFYSGIGWDRSSVDGHRNEKILRFFEDKELLRLFGPEKSGNGSRPWRDFPKSYLGEIPFDGTSIFDKINESQFYLALSSESHRRNGIPSNRIFEAIAGGALPVIDSDLHLPFNTEDFIVLDRSKSVTVAIEEVFAEINSLVQSPSARLTRVANLQKILRDSFTLETQLGQLIDFLSAAMTPQRLTDKSSANPVMLVHHVFATANSSARSDGIAVSDPIKNTTQLWMDQNLTNSEYVCFSSHDHDHCSRLHRWGLTPNPDVIHLTGKWTGRGEDMFLGVLSPPSDLRIIDTIIVKSSVVASWVGQSGGLASLGSLLLGCVEDSATDSPKLSHSFVHNASLDLVDSSPPRNIASATSSLDRVILLRLIQNSSPLVAHLAELALKYEDKTPQPASVLVGLAREIRAMGLGNLLRTAAREFGRVLIRPRGRN
jgi:hypothetical protein